MTQATGATGYVPVVTMGITEKAKYEQMWDRPEYRMHSPGEDIAQVFLKTAGPKQGSKVIDFGCGTGRGSLMLAVLGGLDVTMLDFAGNCLDEDIKPMLETQKHTMRFVEQDLTKPIEVSAEYGYCTDVMEHIPPEDVDKVLDNVLRSAQHVFFQIATTDDVCGQLIGQKLHLTVQPYEWWLKKFNDRDCMIHWTFNREGQEGHHLGHCMFYVSAWQTAQAITDVGVLNIEEQTVRANVKTNIAGPYGERQITPHETNEMEVMILGGGPSLENHLEQIKEMRADGVKLITLNGAYNWALEHGLTPSAQIMVDARPFNARFVKPVVDGCKYLVASQCDPSVLEGLPHERTFLWHTTADMVRDLLDDRYPAWYGVPGGSTVLLRAIPLMRMLGYTKFHLFGCDSCIMEDKHHAFSQVENDNDPAMPVIVGGRTFKCTPWMASQAQEFVSLVQYLGDGFEIKTYGDGLLNHILQTGAKLEEENEWLK